MEGSVKNFIFPRIDRMEGSVKNFIFRAGPLQWLNKELTAVSGKNFIIRLQHDDWRLSTRSGEADNYAPWKSSNRADKNRGGPVCQRQKREQCVQEHQI